jgi:hypothetical protein
VLAQGEIQPSQEINGTITINYSGRWDSIVINSQIEHSSDVFSYSQVNNKNIKHPYARLSIFKSELGGNNIITFTASTNHIPRDEQSNAKFRVSIIQEHKEVANDIAYTKIRKMGV